MSNIVIYMVIGTLFAGFLDIASAFRSEDERFSNWERFWIITLWPIMMLTFIYYFFNPKK